MTTILVDSCVVSDLSDPDNEFFAWSADALASLEHDNKLIINPIIYSECSIGYETIEEIDTLIASLGLDIDQIPKESLFFAGKAFLLYKKRNGAKANVLPDFFIGAHAAVCDYTLVTRDKGRFSTYFPKVKLIMP